MIPCLRPHEIFRRLRPTDFTDAALLEGILIDLGINHSELAAHEFPDSIRARDPGLRIWQHPRQLAEFLCFLAGKSREIRSYIELGSRWGGTFYVIDSFLRALNPEFERSVALDSEVAPLDWDAYHARFPTSEFLRVDSSGWRPDRGFDLCLIDTDHHHDFVMAEYERAKAYCRWLAFHDIVSAVCPEVPLAWAEIAARHPGHREFVAQYPGFREVMGIGLIETGGGEDGRSGPAAISGGTHAGPSPEGGPATTTG